MAPSLPTRPSSYLLLATCYLLLTATYYLPSLPTRPSMLWQGAGTRGWAAGCLVRVRVRVG
eukprot:scaffold52251_cov18-Phaeocystis_antarctica.AAC.1